MERCKSPSLAKSTVEAILACSEEEKAKYAADFQDKIRRSADVFNTPCTLVYLVALTSPFVGRPYGESR